jgi:hypothetical protein
MKKLCGEGKYALGALTAFAFWLFVVLPAFSAPNNGGGTEFWPPFFGYRLKVTDTLVALFTFGLFVATLFLFRATQKLVVGAQETAQRQLRAYVSVKEIVMDALRNPPHYGLQGEVQPGAIHSFRFSVIVENTGQTPTRHSLININWQVRPDVLPATFDYPDGEPEIAVIGARSPFGTPGFFISLADVNRVAAREQRLFLWGWVDYDDVFEATPRHRTEFCFEAIADRLLDAGNIPMRFPNFGRYNAMDADCVRRPEPFKAPGQ